MSYKHYNTLDDIKREYDEVVAVLGSLSSKARRSTARRNETLAGMPVFDPARINSAIVHAHDAYALLLIATSEGFMRDYLVSLSVSVGPDPNLSSLIDKCRKEFNRTSPKVPIRPNEAVDLHYLRRKRNEYAHGLDTSVFPPIRRVVTILGRFFANIP